MDDAKEHLDTLEGYLDDFLSDLEVVTERVEDKRSIKLAQELSSASEKLNALNAQMIAAIAESETPEIPKGHFAKHLQSVTENIDLMEAKLGLLLEYTTGAGFEFREIAKKDVRNATIFVIVGGLIGICAGILISFVISNHAVGEIVFKNDDDFTHNLYSKKGAATFDTGVMKPGQTFEVKLAKKGKFTVRCAIHPKMKLRVKVK